MVHVITHRGLEPGAGASAKGESTVEAFEDHLRRGFGIEFDPNPCSDGWAVWHDGSMRRLTGGADERNIVDVPLQDVAGRTFDRGRVGTLDEVLHLIAEHGSADAPSAMHLKGERQHASMLESLIQVLRRHPGAIPKMFVFDVKEDTAVTFKKVMPELALAPSVGHEYDIQRYNACVNHTLWSLETTLDGAQRGLFSWAWVDEWDLLADNAGARKDPPFATQATFAALRGAGLSVGLVTPELHASSPGLLGSEAHEDAKDQDRLFARIRTFAQCGLVDAICTDWPDEVQAMLSRPTA
jgi:hypothetical protein